MVSVERYSPRRVCLYGYRPGHARRICDGWRTVKRLTTRSSWMDFRDVLARRQSFATSGALRGVSGVARHVGYTLGSLPSNWHDSIPTADYVVYSYRTPIAWHVPNHGWITPHERYSVTTSRHQSKVNTAISQLGE